MLPFEATCADCQLLLSTRVHKKWSLSQRGSESLSLGGAEIGMYVNKCILVKNILIGICHVELEEHQSSFQGKSVVRWNVWAGITQSGKSLGVAGGWRGWKGHQTDGRANAKAEVWINMTFWWSSVGLVVPGTGWGQEGRDRWGLALMRRVESFVGSAKQPRAYLLEKESWCGMHAEGSMVRVSGDGRPSVSGHTVLMYERTCEAVLPFS